MIIDKDKKHFLRIMLNSINASDNQIERLLDFIDRLSVDDYNLLIELGLLLHNKISDESQQNERAKESTYKGQQGVV